MNKLINELMNPYFISILTAIIFLIIGYFAGKIITKLKYEKESSTSEAQSEALKNTAAAAKDFSQAETAIGEI